MRYKNCPVCGEAADVGSHWDCVFDLLAEWVKHREKEEREVKPVAGDDPRAQLRESFSTPAPAPASISNTEEGVKNG